MHCAPTISLFGAFLLMLCALLNRITSLFPGLNTSPWVLPHCSSRVTTFHSSLSHYDRDKVQLPPLVPGEAVYIQCDKSKKWEKKGRVLEKRPDGLFYLVDIDGRLAVRSKFFLKPVLQGGKGGASDNVTETQDQDQGEFHSSITHFLLRSPRLVEKAEKAKEKCSSSSCAPAQTIPMTISSASSSGCTGSRPRRQRTPSTSQLVDSRSLIFNGLHLPLGQQQSSSAQCSSSLSSYGAGFVPAISARAGPVMASSSISSGSLLAAPLSPCRSHELPPARSSPLGNPAQQSLSQLLTQTQQGGCGPPPVGPPFLRPTPPTRDSSPGCHTRSSRPFSTMGATSTTPSASAAFRDAAGILYIQYHSRPRLDYDRREDSGHFIELDSYPSSRGASPGRRSVRLTEHSEPAVRYRSQRAQSCQTSRPPSPLLQEKFRVGRCRRRWCRRL